MKFITVMTTKDEETLVNLENVNYIQRTGKQGQYIAIDMNTSMLEIDYSKETWMNITGLIAQAENKKYNRHLQKPLDVKVVNK